jgi:hypothetical protein
MAAVSASDAALEGFQVLRRHWRVAVGWCLFSVIAFVALVVAAFLAILVATLAVSSRDQANTAGGIIGGLIFGLGAFGVEIMVVGALYRLMLRPETPPGLFYLRISREEARLALLWLIVLVGLGAALTAGYAVVGALGFLGWGGHLAGVIAAGLAILWLALRFSLAGPATLVSGGLGLAQSWRLTRGHVWSLAGATVIAACLFALLAIVVWLAVFFVQAAIGGFHSFAPVSLSDPEALAERPGAYVFGMLAELALGPVFWVIASAPFAAIYRDLTAARAA